MLLLGRGYLGVVYDLVRHIIYSKRVRKSGEKSRCGLVFVEENRP